MLISFASSRMSHREHGVVHRCIQGVCNAQRPEMVKKTAPRLWPAGSAVYPPLLGGVPDTLSRAPRGTLFGRARCERILTEDAVYA